MNATFGYNQHYKQAFLRLEDRRFDITVDIDFHELLVLKNELDSVLDIIKEADIIEAKEDDSE